MPPTTGDRLLAAWLSLTSTLWNKRLVSTLTYNEAHVLGILLRAEDTGRDCTATTLIAQTRLLKSQMNKVLTTLEGKGFLLRMRSEADKRVILIHLTEAGSGHLAEHEHIAAILNQLIDTLSRTKRALTDGINESCFRAGHLV
ncbi:MAG: transcriptional regulator, SarA/Rot family [Christensenellales bacterium]